MAMHTIKFTFDPGSKRVTADDVVRALRTVLGATGELDEWQIRRMTLGSPLVVEARCPNKMHKPVAAFVRRMNAVARGKKPRGGLTGPDAKLLDSVDFVTKRVFGAISIAPSGTAPVKMNQDAVARARSVTGQMVPSLMIHSRQQMGQLRGYLEQITARRGERPRFGIRDRVSGELVLCLIPEGLDSLLDSAKRSLGRRVVVTGLIHYGGQSQPTSIKAEVIDSIEDGVIPFDQLPRIPLTDDGNAVAYVRRQRDG